MSPREVVNAAVRNGIDLIGICDHNSAENVLAVKKAGERNGLMVLGGMEVTSSEEAHILVFFEDDDDLLDFQEYVYRHLAGRNDEHTFGLQVIADDEDGVTGFCDKLLIGATSLSAEAIVAKARAAKGESLVIAAHVDRESFSIIGQLGFIPPGLALDAVEISGMTAAEAKKQFPDCSELPVVTGSDAHQSGRYRQTVYLVDRRERDHRRDQRRRLTGRDNRKAEC